jgi:23S rRNA U2552 (ribose-2'-O)-methylase RlmE/FtsJ
MNDLEKYFEENKGHVIFKWLHYFDIYERHFARFRGKDPVVVEFGVGGGGSLRMWKDYFGAGSRIYGIDHNNLHHLADPDNGIQVLRADQNDRPSLDILAKWLPEIDILIDDGGHHMHQQINTFESMYPVIQPNGVYLCEDTHTSYRAALSETGGQTYIEYAKDLIDLLYDKNHTETGSIHFYNRIVVIEKKIKTALRCKKTGEDNA